MKCPDCRGVGTVNGIYNCPSCKGIGIIKNKQVDSNEMPELKAGMVVELETSDSKLIVLPNKEGSRLVLVYKNGVYSDTNMDITKIKKIYTITKTYNYAPFFMDDDLNDGVCFSLIWSKNKSKIEEIEQTILKLQQEVKELKNE